jgi:LmeA-like phospholipid-binding
LYTYQAPKRRSRGAKIVVWIVAVLVLLVVLDFGAKAFAENEAADQIQKHGFPKKPSVSIAGFPFLTQVITRDFHQITISATDIPEGPIKITSMKVVATHVKLNSSFNGGTTGPLHGTVLISLGEVGGFLQAAGPIAQFIGGGSGGGIRVVAVGSSELKANLNALGGSVNGSATWRVTRVGSDEIHLRLVSSGGDVPSGLLDRARSITIPLKSLPAGLRLTGKLSSSSGGIVAHVFADSLSFGS